MEALTRKINKIAKKANVKPKFLLDILEYTMTPKNVKRLIAQRQNKLNKKLHAGSRNNIGEMERLLKEGADVNSKDGNDSTLLMYAAASGDNKICAFLIKNGANVNAKSKDGTTARTLAILSGHLETSRFLSEKGAV
jgi:ankyrin repeat protein